MPTAAFIKAASASNRQPVVLLAIESIDAIKRAVTTQPDWAASTKTNINTASEPGRIFLTTDDDEPYQGDYSTGVVASSITSPPAVSQGDGTWLATTPIFYSHTNVTSIVVTFDAYRGYLDFLAPTWSLYGRRNGGSWELLDTIASSPHANRLQNTSLVKGQWDFKLEALAGFSMVSIWPVSYESIHHVTYLTAGTITTPSVDLGVVPSLTSRFQADDIIPTGCTLTYTAWGSNNNSTWTSLGTITDGATLAAYRYYYFKADFTSSGLYTPYIDELRVIGGDSQYDYFSTHKDTPVQGAKPYIAPGGVSSLSSKIDLINQATVGELTLKLHWRKLVGDMIATGYLKNKTLICKIGFLGLAEQDYEPYFTGTWYDYQSDHEKEIISVKTRNILKRFNRNVPEAGYYLDANGAVFNPPKVYTLSGNIMDVILNIADLSGIPDRYLDRGTFLEIGAGARSGADWNVSRTLKESEDASKMIHELAVSAGIFMVELPDGRLSAKLYDDFLTDPPAATFDAFVHSFKPVEGGQKDLYTRQAIYYQLIPGKDGGSASDYGKGYIPVNAAAEINWAESNTREWMDMWGLSTTAIQMLAQRWDSWFANPRNSVKVENVPPRFWELERGQVVAVDNLRLPCPAEEWEGYTSGARYLVMGKTISDPTSTSLTFSYELQALGDATFTPDPDFPTYSPMEFWPLVTGLTVAERLVTLPGGAVQTLLDVAFDLPSDMHFGGAQVWARENSGAWVYQASGNSGGPSVSRIISFPVTEGTTVDVAVLTVNAAGLVMAIDDAPQASATILGKTAPPTNVSGLTSTYSATDVMLKWSPISDLDLDHYEVRQGSTWETAVLVVSGLTAPEYVWTPPSLGSYTLLVKAVDTTGNFSVTAATTTITATQPADVTGLICTANQLFIDLSWTPVAGCSYEIRLGASWAAGSVLVTGHASGTFQYQPKSTGNQQFWIKALDSRGNYSVNAVAATLVINAATLSGLSQQVIDNNVLLRWTNTAGTYAIDYCEIRRGLDFATATVVGKLTGTFTTLFESVAGTYKYWIVAVDIAGLYGPEVGAYAVVNQPPDFVLKDERALAWTGTKTNCLLDGGSLYACVNTTETWTQHFTGHSWTTPQDQITAGYPYYLQPGMASGSYVETIDYGALIPNTKISLALTKTAIVGTVTITPTISISADGSAWTDYAGAYEVYAVNFRYVKISLAFASADGGLLVITDSLVRLDVKLKTQQGMAAAVSTDTGGTAVDITGQFLDVQAITLTPQGTTPITAIYDFVDAANPTQFKILLFNSAGARVSGTVSWAVRGV